MRSAAVGLLLACLSPVALANPGNGSPTAVRVQVPSLQAYPADPALGLEGWWYRVEGSHRAPAVLLLHGCGGMLNNRGEPSSRTREYAALLHGRGWHVLAIDSLTTRGEKELCTQRIGNRKVTQTERRKDTLGALLWLAKQPEVDAARLALLGWSNGGSAVLASNNRTHPLVDGAPVRPRLAVAFYPGCEADLRRGYRPAADTLILVGLADDWTPAAPCQQLESAGSPVVKVLAYEGAYHGFDSLSPVRLRTDVPNGVYPGSGVHVGGNAAARQAAQQAMVQALESAFASR